MHVSLQVSHTFYTDNQIDRVRLLNEVASKAKALGTSGSGIPVPTASSAHGSGSGGGSGPSVGGRAAFWRGPSAHVVGAMPADWGGGERGEREGGQSCVLCSPHPPLESKGLSFTAFFPSGYCGRFFLCSPAHPCRPSAPC